MKTLLAVFMLFFITISASGCLTSREERAYLDKVRKVPLEFTVDDEHGELAWMRAQKFLAKYISSPIKTVTPYVIQTETTQDFFQNDVYFCVTRTPTNDGQRFEIRRARMCQSDAHILAHYMQTGELPYPGVIGW